MILQIILIQKKNARDSKKTNEQLINITLPRIQSNAVKMNITGPL